MPLFNSSSTNSQPSPTRRQPSPSTTYPKPIPDSLEAVLSDIETLAEKTTLPLAEPDSEFHELFRNSFTPKEPYEDHELWDQVDVFLNARIGPDVLPRTLHRGQYGIDGLFRHWLVPVRAFRGWDAHCDQSLEAKLRDVVTLLKRKVKPPQVAPPGVDPRLLEQSTSSQQSGSQSTSTLMPLKRPIEANSLVTPDPKKTKLDSSTANSQDEEVPQSVQEPAPTGLWMMAQSPLFGLTSASIEANKLVTQDVPQVYRAAINLLFRRKEGINLPAKPPAQEAEPFGVKNKLSVTKWLAKNPSE